MNEIVFFDEIVDELESILRTIEDRGIIVSYVIRHQELYAAIEASELVSAYIRFILNYGKGRWHVVVVQDDQETGDTEERERRIMRIGDPEEVVAFVVEKMEEFRANV